MPLYAVCFQESVADYELISVVEANSKEDAHQHHFRKFAYISEYFRKHIMNLSSDGFYYSYFDSDFDAFRETFADIPSFIKLNRKSA